MAYSDADLQVKTGSAAFAQCQANFIALTAEALTIAAVKTFSSSPIIPTPTTDMQASTKKYVDDAFKALYPVGALYISTVSTNPNTLLGFGTWATFGAGKVMVGIDSGDANFDVAEETGGAKTHTLVTAEMPAHTHTQTNQNTVVFGVNAGGGPHPETAAGNTGSTGGGGAHNNLQPYIVIYSFKRTA